jgi:nucleotide-binding universal stress UspA family protein
MAYIIATTDFSAVAENAVHYAAALAAQYRMDMVLLHTFTFPIMVGEVVIPASLIEDTHYDAEKRVAEMIEEITARHPTLNLNTIVAMGDILERIGQYAHEHTAPAMVVMGNSNTSGQSAWFLSTLKSATINLPYPVLAIPPGVSYIQPATICIATDFEQPENVSAMEQLNELTSELGAALHVLSVQEDISYNNEVELNEAIENTTLKNAQYHFVNKVNVDIDEAILSFCHSNSYDWLVVVPGKYSFFERLFHSSHTKAIASKADLPLLILHGRNEAE